MPLEPFDLILFGGSGDLAMRKLLPALYYRHRDTADATGWRIVGVGREDYSREAYLAKVEAHARQFINPRDFDEAAWASFAGCLDYVPLDARQPADFERLAGLLANQRLAEVVVNFRDVPHALFPSVAGERVPNRLVIRLRPDESLQPELMAKVPGDEMRLRPVTLNLDFAETYHGRQWDAYERLLMDVIRGKFTLFMRRDELNAAWRWIEPILDGWGQDPMPPRPYSAGTWGPAASSALVGRDGLAWLQDS